MKRIAISSPVALIAAVMASMRKIDASALPPWKAWPLRMLLISIAVLRDLADGQLNLRAMSLVYTTLLSLVPLLAISFSVLKGFGVHNQLEPALLNFLRPLGDQGVEIAQKIIEFVENIKVGVLGSLGLGLLVYTAISLMQKIERAFNYTWHVSQERSLAQRFSGYLSVIMVGPVLVFASMGLTASVRSHWVVEQVYGLWGVGTVVEWAGLLVPYFLIVMAFSLIYVLMPNTRVRFSSALVGALVAGLLWKTIGWAFSSFIVTSGKYTAVYSAFATLIMFMIWLYLAWLILLLGASIAFYFQKPEYLGTSRRELILSNVVRERLAVLAMVFIGRHFYGERPPLTLERLAHRLRAPMVAVERTLSALEDAGLVSQTGDSPAAFVPARPLENMPVLDVLHAVRTGNDHGFPDPERFPSTPGSEKVFAAVDGAFATALTDMTVKDVALAADPAPLSEVPAPEVGPGIGKAG